MIVNGWKTLFAALTAALTLVFSAAGLSLANENAPAAEAGFSALSAYIWRGQEMTRDSMVLQPSATVTYNGFSLNLWGNIDTRPYKSDNPASPAFAASPDGRSSTWTETDLTLSYSRAIGPFTVGGGYIYYGLYAPFAGSTDPLDAQEIYLTATLNKFLAPTVTVFKEVDHYHQWYILLGISHQFEITKAANLKLTASASYLKSADASTYSKYNDAAQPTADKFSNFHDGTVGAQLPVSLSKRVVFTPQLSFVFPLSDDAKNEMKGRSRGVDRSSFLYGGASLAFSF